MIQLAWHYLTNVLMQSQRLRPNWAMDNCPGPPPNAKTLGTAAGWWRSCLFFCWETKIDVENQQTCIILYRYIGRLVYPIIEGYNIWLPTITEFIHKWAIDVIDV